MAEQSETEHQPREEDLRDLGFGSRVSEEARLRLLNRDGTFNVNRRGISRFRAIGFYQALLTMSWWRFHAAILLSYLSVNAAFALGFLACGPNALQGLEARSLAGRFLEAFFFSVQTFTTVGYGHITPQSLAANLVATLDAFMGLMGFALATGLLFARFSRPTARICFSRNALVAPYQGAQAFEFRVINERRNVLIEVQAKVVFSRMEWSGDRRVRRFYPLALERDHVAFFPLHWTIVHPIQDDSPLSGLTQQALVESESEFLILITAIDDTFSQTVHTRSSYKAEEVLWDTRFKSMFGYDSEGVLSVDLKKLDWVERT